MSEYKELHVFPDPWYVKRTQDEDVVTNLLDAERIVITKEIDSQREFGTVKVECFSESYSEFWCDSVE